MKYIIAGILLSIIKNSKAIFESILNFIINNLQTILIVILIFAVLAIIGHISEKREKNKKLKNEEDWIDEIENEPFENESVGERVTGRKIKKKQVNVLLNNLDLKSKTDVQRFIKEWKVFYRDPREKLYKNNIQKSKFGEEDLMDLYVWKNGGKLSELKRKSLTENIIRKLDVVNELKSDFDIDKFESEFKYVSAIWKIFLLHLIKPDLYPIFDQHVCRAYYYIEKKISQEIPNNNHEKEEVYFHEYFDFFNRLATDGIDRKELDEALWAFGKYLKDKNCPKYQKM